MPVAYFFKPLFDMATIYSSYWLTLAAQDVAALGYTVIQSAGEYATKYSFFDNVSKYNPELIVADGHGDPSTLTGQGLQEVLTSCFNNEVLSGRMMCSISCLTGQVLGPNSVEKQARAYIGFVNEFTWTVLPPYNPGNDPSAYPFQQIVRKLIVLAAQYNLGKIRARDVYDGAIAEIDRWIAASYPLEYAEDVLMALRHDRSGLVTISKEVTIGPAPTPLFPFLIMGTGAAMTFGLVGMVLIPFIPP